MNIEEITIGQAREIAAMFETKAGNAVNAVKEKDGNPYVIGKTYVIRTVTMIDVGTVVRVTSQEIILKDAAWIADTGRFSEAISKAEFSEVEPFPDGEIIVGRNAVIDACQINKKAPRAVK